MDALYAQRFAMIGLISTRSSEMVAIDIIIDALMDIGGEASSRELCKLIGCSQAEVSQKLRILHDQGYLLKYPREGLRGYVSIYVLTED